MSDITFEKNRECAWLVKRGGDTLMLLLNFHAGRQVPYHPITINTSFGFLTADNMRDIAAKADELNGEARVSCGWKFHGAYGEFLDTECGMVDLDTPKNLEDATVVFCQYCGKIISCMGENDKSTE